MPEGDLAPSAPHARVALQPLACPSCAGLVPLADGATTTCPYCKATVDIPAEYRALRAAARQSAADRAKFEEACARIGEPPGLLLRLWAGAAGGVAGLLWTTLTAFLRLWVRVIGFMIESMRSGDDIVMVLVALAVPPAVVAAFFLVVFWLGGDALHAIAGALHVDLLDVFGPWRTYGALGVLTYLGAAVPVGIYQYGEAFADVRQRIQAGLAAAPPQNPGGPARCRSCGAPLEVPVGALGVRCDYCGAENLVALPQAWVNAVKTSERAEHAEVGQALKHEEFARRHGRKRLSRTLIFSLVLIPGFACGGSATCSEGWVLAATGDWRAAVASGQRVVRLDRDGDVVAARPQRFATLEHDPTGVDGDAHFEVALRRGEDLRIETDADLPAQELFYLSDTSAKRTFEINWIKAARAQGYFAAPYDGWYALRVALDGPWAMSGRRLSLGWSVVRRRADAPSVPAPPRHVVKTLK